ncbi:M48 family metalloprotease [Pseudovibrio sp. WM33]|uniref:M48 family metalloprotease n=1 Tax=Pseudovibrio sp. WM33 TaxID=1735585 RepID=UPI0007AE6AB0|nr:M48 family metalloprotease [Pseudovibrio sp. WM33]KZL26592.1 TPR repeat-containing protein YfgC precursor [Pseudovibrio sp. WM33]
MQFKNNALKRVIEPVKSQATKFARKILITATALSLVVPNVAITTAQAQQKKGLPLVRDAETEDLLREYAKPIFRAAGLPANQVEIILVNDKSFNAFVPDSRRMFINLGVIMDAKTPSEVIGVIAHETGHIAGNHLVRMRQAASNAQIMSVIGMILGAGAMAAGATTGNSSIARGGAAAVSGGGALAQRNFLSYRRSEESSADQAALRYLDRVGVSAKGMLTTFERMADQALFSAQYVDPYALSHPMPRARFNALQNRAQKAKHFNKKDPERLQLKHDMVKAKLLAFTSHRNSVYRAYPERDKSLPAQYARAIASMRSDKASKAVRKIDALISKAPEYPYFYEIKGQALLEGGKPKAAIAPFRKALALYPGNPHFEIWLGFAMVASDDKRYLKEAKSILTRALRKDRYSMNGYAQLAIANARLGDIAGADLATAQSHMTRGDVRSAQRYAKRAQKKLKVGSPAWQQADDILSVKAPQLRRR